VAPETFRRLYKDLNSFNPLWNEIPVSGSTDFYEWRDDSTYIHEPPFFESLDKMPEIQSIKGARVLGLFGDSITTDHISPAGNIASNSPAGRYLIAHGVEKRDFNTYGTRRGNDLIMLRGTFANIRIKNQLLPGHEGVDTIYFPTGEQMPIFDAAEKYGADGTPLIVIAGKAYGMGSSRDWAAKGTYLFGVRAVIAESYERIHRSNLVGMGVLPLQFKPGENAQTFGLTGHETFDIALPEKLRPRQDVTVHATRQDGSTFDFTVTARIDTPVEVDYYRNGGILQTVMRNMLAGNRSGVKA